MELKRQCINGVVGVSLSLLAVLIHPLFAEDAPQFVTGQSQLSAARDPADSSWLPDIIGLPNEEQVESLTRHVAEVMTEEEDKNCTAIDYNLRMLVFQNFVIYQHMANAQHHYFKEKMALKYAHVLAMILKESSGDPTNVTDMNGRSISTSKPGTNLQRWSNLLKLTMQNGIKFNYQTNFGLTQLSADRLFVAFKLANGASHSKDFLEGKNGDETPNRVDMDSAIAIRRLIWFYQDIAQGRLKQKDECINEEDIYKPEFNERYQAGLRMALLYCGTKFLFRVDNESVWVNENSTFEKAMASIAYCKLGNSKTGYGTDEMDERCFAEWVTLCPALNVNIALLTPLSYFQTRKNKPVCTNTLNRLLNKEPKN
ncbi:TPA: hypothetical protein ACIZB4_000737 [Legionella pneumophila]|uniref:hypothetical protein n=1 Tax=Legionella pneumophila TaxID=446 RepID=UPI000489F247|nr:hypothetical protein [Legionella pneumophila]ANH13224.1 hypothetical protein A5478_09365 [Legionella pneumophila]ANH16190.1 hypothetical protein A5480_09360 [Legionella pneumophila]ANH19157.1 hypothetical protein A5479_09360 [Legionella pneumophila]APX20044.1 hypothetical protein A1D14_09375 [Legionella pneumophila]AQL12221.1 hypothetical protein A1D13_09375 [Legionella pneumophila]